MFLLMCRLVKKVVKMDPAVLNLINSGTLDVRKAADIGSYGARYNMFGYLHQPGKDQFIPSWKINSVPKKSIWNKILGFSLGGVALSAIFPRLIKR